MQKNLCLIVVAIAILSMISVYPVQAITMLDQEYLSALAMDLDTCDWVSISGDATSYLDGDSYLVTFDGRIISGALLCCVDVFMPYLITDLSWEKIWDTTGAESMTITVGGVGSFFVSFLIIGIAEWSLNVESSFDSEETSVEVGILAYAGSDADYDDCELSLAEYLSISASNGGTTDPAPGTYAYGYGSSVTVKATAYYGYGFDYWDLDGGMYMQNPIIITMDQPHTLEAHFKSTSGGGGGGGSCPTLFVWNGTAYVEEGVLDIHAYSDVTVHHEIQNTLGLENGVYNLQLWELDNNTSHIDQVRLYAVDSEGEWHLCALTYAYHSELGRVKHTLRFDDDSRVDLNPTETINLKFAEAECETTCFIFEINGYNRKTHT